MLSPRLELPYRTVRLGSMMLVAVGLLATLLKLLMTSRLVGRDPPYETELSESPQNSALQSQPG
jgi:hypothetical protein